MQLTDSSRDLMFGHLCSGLLVDRPCHLMNVTGAVSFGQVQLMWLDNGRHHSMRERVAMMAALDDEATIVHLNEHPFEYFRCRYCCCDYRLICCSLFDWTMRLAVVAVVAIVKYF